MVIETLVNGTLIPPFPFQAPEDLNLHATECGANNYFYTNSTVHWVMVNVPSC